MKRVTGIGGIFFKCKDPETMKKWYRDHLGINMNDYGSTFVYEDRGEAGRKAILQWSPFPEDTTYFNPSNASFMINYRVDDLEALVKALKSESVRIVDEIETYEYGKFVHILEPEDNSIELWEPIDSALDQDGEGRMSVE